MISVIIPVYNVAQYLNRCLESVIKQTWTNLEIILVDDGSTDGCDIICKEWTKRDTRVQCIHQPNQGLSMARNAGLAEAHGEYITFVDSDDWIEPEMFQSLIQAMKTYDTDISMCRFVRYWANGKRIPVGNDHQIRVYDRNDALREYLLGINVDPFAWGKLYKSSIIAGHRFIPGIIGEDIPYNIDIFKKISRLVLIGEGYYIYQQERPGAITHASVSSKRVDNALRWEQLRQGIIQDIPSLEPYALRRQAIFYIGLFNRIYTHPEYTKEVDIILSFLKENKNRLLHSNICEKTVKIAVLLLSTVPRLYCIVMIMYKKIIGEAKL